MNTKSTNRSILWFLTKVILIFWLVGLIFLTIFYPGTLTIESAMILLIVLLIFGYVFSIPMLILKGILNLI
jgi:hypothetical protein